MAKINLQEAKQLCTAAELKLFRLSWLRSAMGLTVTQLRANIARVRKLRDKYRDLARRQRLEARGKRAASGRRPAQGNERTVRKAELFSQVLDQFQTRLAVLGKPEETHKAASRPKRAKRKTSAKPKTVPVKADSEAPPKSVPAEKVTSIAKKKTARQGRKGTSLVPDLKQKKKNLRRKASSDRALPTSKANRITRSGSRKIAAHVSSAGRRRQARRDVSR